MNVIYKITNIHNGKFLIGSTNNPEKRWIRHKSKARCGKHINRYFQFEWNKYGEQAFVFSILEIVDKECDLRQIEQNYLDDFYEHPLCINLNPNADCPKSWKGKKRKPFTTEHRRKISVAQIGRINSQSSNDKRREAMKNRMENFTLISPDGKIVKCEGFRITATKFDLDYRHLIAIVRQKRKSHKGWKLYVA